MKFAYYFGVKINVILIVITKDYKFKKIVSHEKFIHGYQKI